MQFPLQVESSLDYSIMQDHKNVFNLNHFEVKTTDCF